MYPFYIGIDLHLRHIYVVPVDTNYVQICEPSFLVWVKRECNWNETGWKQWTYKIKIDIMSNWLLIRKCFCHFFS